MALHLTKVAVGCRTIEALEKKIAGRARDGEARVPTRMRPRRQDELIGGFLHWIIRHRIVARQAILRFDGRADGRIDIVCSAALELVAPTPRRAHQGWRYLADGAVGADDPSGLAQLPPRLYGKLAALGLV